MDYATWYPEALPLRAATVKAVARELMLLFSRVGIAKEVLTDQGSCFMSRVMKELRRLLQVKQLGTSVYHPQTDGLVERFNKTLKQMLKKAMDTDGKNWDQLLPHVLFAVREVPQASTGFSLFELLYGRRPRGITKGYWQVPLTRAAREKRAFSTPGGLYQYTVLPFGVHGAPATFQRMMDQLLRPQQAKLAAHIDDIIIYSHSWDVDIRQLRPVLGELRKAGLTANPAKCRLGLEETAYLGYQVGRGTVRPQESKVAARDGYSIKLS